MKDVREYLHLYYGQECLEAIIVPGQDPMFHEGKLNSRSLFHIESGLGLVRLICSRLSDMTEEDAKESRELFDRLNQEGKLNGEIEATRTVWAISKGYWLFGDEYFDKGLIIDKKTLQV